MRSIGVLTVAVALTSVCCIGCIPSAPTASKPAESPAAPAPPPDAAAPGSTAAMPADPPTVANTSETEIAMPDANGSGRRGLVVSFDDKITGGSTDFQLPKVQYEPQEGGAVIHFKADIGEPDIRLQGTFRRVGPRAWEMTGAFKAYTADFKPGEPVINVMGEYLPFQQTTPYEEQTPNVLVMIPAMTPPPGTPRAQEETVYPINQTFTAPDYSIFAILLPPF